MILCSSKKGSFHQSKENVAADHAAEMGDVRNACKVLLHTVLYTQPLKMELTEGSETSTNHNLTPGKYPKEYIQQFFFKKLPLYA
jgi:hypothetical protein